MLGVAYQRNPGGDFDRSNVSTIRDGEGVVRRHQVGLGSNAADAASLLASLAR